MRRLFVLLLVLVALLAAVGPALVGLAAESLYPRAIARLDDSLTDYRIESPRFDRGWLLSEFSFSAQADDAPPLQLGGRLRQGPLTVWPPSWAAGTVALHREQKPLATAIYRVTPAFELRATVRPAAEVGSGQLEFEMTRAGDRLRAEARELTVGDVVSGLAGTMLADNDDTQPRSFAADLRAQSLSLAAARTIDQPVMSLDGRQDGENLDLELGFRAQALELDDRRLGGLRLELALRRLHAPTVIQLVQSIGDLLEKAPAGKLPVIEIQNTLVTGLGPLLLNRPEVELALSGNSTLGEFAVEADASLQQRPPASFIRDFSLLLQVLKLEMTATFDRRLLEAWARHRIAQEYPGIDPAMTEELQRQYLANLRNNAIIEPAGDSRYRMKLDYTPGRAILNGHAMSLPDDWSGM